MSTGVYCSCLIYDEACEEHSSI